jgi:hypothetical protein
MYRVIVESVLIFTSFLTGNDFRAGDTSLVHYAQGSQKVIAQAPSSFKHPGVLNSAASLDFVKQKVNSGQQPWKGAYDKMMSSEFGSLTRNPHPTATVVRLFE